MPLHPRRAVTVLAVLLAACSVPSLRAEPPAALRVTGEDYPRAFFFRSSEGFAAHRRTEFTRWEACFSRLMGIEGKVLEEEVPGRSVRNIDFFTRFKKRHPEQLVLLHYNGNARDPRFERGEFFAGHWLYYNGATILADVPADEGEIEIQVSDASLFRTGMGRYRDSADDIGLCRLDEEGRPDWSRSEQVQLVSVDRRRGMIRVRRGCYGTTPRAFSAKRSYAAAHMTEGPWGRKSHLLWYYNYATCCPRDAKGRTCGEVHADELARRFLPGGELAAFDGLEFDVLHHEAGRRGGKMGADCNADGKADFGRVGGVNRYGIGVVEFCRRLRNHLGEKRLILADGMSTRGQRAFGILNGIESEGWPTLSDHDIRDWSGGLNRHFYWNRCGAAPAWSYVNHKFIERGEAPGVVRHPDLPCSTHRLVLAAAMMTDAAVCYSQAPPKQPGEMLGIWDELRKGTEHEIGWLGRPLGPPVRMALREPDALDGVHLAERIAGEGVAVAEEDGAVRVAGREADAEQTRFIVRDVPCDGPDLLVTLTARGAPLKDYPEDVARLAWLGVARPQGQLVHADLPPAGMCLRGGKEREIDAASGASVRFQPGRRLNDDPRDAYLVHPPYKGAVGYTFWHRDVTVPKGGRLELFTGMGEKAPERSDGVTFRVLARELRDGQTPGEREVLLEHSQKESRWVAHRVDLAPYARQRVRLTFVSDCGPADDSTTDHSYWAGVFVVGPEGRQAVTPSVRFMTWLGREELTSTFYFSDVRTRAVDLELSIEGAGPIWIADLGAHPGADALYREFQRGLVLANPSPRPYTFDLEKLLPGRRFRRLRGSSRQDPQTNDGSPVRGTLTLGPKDGLFLIADQTVRTGTQ